MDFVANPFLSFKRRQTARAAALTLALLLPALPALAADIDPFQFDTAHWMSFDRYKDKTKNSAGYIPEGATSEAVAASEKTDAADAVTPPAAAPAAAATAAIAAPTRPINPPVMPGMNKGYNLDARSTEDDAPPAQIAHIDTQPTLHLAEKSWQKVSDVAQLKPSDSGDESEHMPLNIRMSFLPNSQITPVPSQVYNSNHGRAPAEAAVVVPPPEPAKKSDLASCAAIDAYKKKQLQAIQGDRQTLAALQAAIADLGLQKQLDFIAGAKGNLGAQASNAGGIDISADGSAPSLATR